MKIVRTDYACEVLLEYVLLMDVRYGQLDFALSVGRPPVPFKGDH